MDGAPSTPLRRSADHFAALVADSFDAIVSKDLDGIVVSWNSAAERLFGWSADEMIGSSITRIIPEDRLSEETEIIARIRRGESIEKFTTLRKGKNGELVPVSVTISPVRDEEGRIVGASKIANDLSDQTRLRVENARHRAQFEALADNIPQLAWMADPSGWIFWYNRRWYDYTGTDFAAMEGWGWKRVHHPDHVARVEEHFRHAIGSGTPWEDTFPLRSGSGEYRWFLSRANPLRDEHGDIVLWCGTNTDVTEERKDKERIRLLMEEVNHRARNMLATIQSIARRTVGTENRPLLDAFVKRIQALATNQDILNEGEWTGAPVEDIVRRQVAHVADGDPRSITITGPGDVVLSPPAAESLGLAIHELATNALKHGALSVEGGSVAIAWNAPAPDGMEPFEITWTESGGPAVAPPTREGFGTLIIRRNPEMTMRAKVDLDFDQGGLRWHLIAPADAIFPG